MRFNADVINTHDKECLTDVTKVLITGKTILTEFEPANCVKFYMVIHGME